MTVTGAAPTLVSGQLDEIAADVRRLVANNASYMTGPGTNTYIVGRERFAVIDPGPAAEPHVQRILQETGGRIAAVLVTHTHRDHSPAAQAIAAATGAEVLGRTAPDDGRQDLAFTATRMMNDGDALTVDDLTLRAVHTPGHASNHLCFVLEGTGLIFTGDHLMQGSTVVIAPPDGNMSQYLRSLQRLQNEPVTRIAPGHGLTIEDAQSEIEHIIAHRLKREAKVVERLAEMGKANLDALVARVYDDVDSRLHPLAKSSLLAHLLKLEEDGRVRSDSDAQWQVIQPGQ
ncbi:MAG TPA: MBL fold metallo-hydrolase [Povalibacter sp.]|nr:MBL fold metallo-hydrolase [Povalibacter sp.]